jgi:thiamine-phosphate pyrophosphorylase
MALQLPKLYPILDAGLLPTDRREEFLAHLIAALANAGVTLLQYRNKLGPEDRILADAEIIRYAADGRLTLIMNDHPHLALQASFDGAHVGQNDISPQEARKILGPGKILGVSTHNRLQLEAAQAQPVDYVAIGPVFPTSTKSNADPVVGLDGVSEARRLTAKPLVAIGGMTLANAPQVLKAGADSIAVISAIFKQSGMAATEAGKFIHALKTFA